MPDYICTDPTATIKRVGDSLRISLKDENAMLIVLTGTSSSPVCQVVRLDTGWASATRDPLLIAAIAPPVPAPLTDVEIDILNTLAREHPRAVCQVDIEATTDVSRRTIGRRLKRLRTLELIRRPDGEHGGEALTDRGLRVAAHFAH